MITRRTILQTTGSAALLGFFPFHISRADAIRQTGLIRATAIKSVEPKKPFDFQLFYDLSRYVCARADLDRNVAQLHHKHFAAEEWGWTNGAKLYALIEKELAAGVASVPELMLSGKLSDFDQWYARHLLDSWYEGIYRYEGRELRVTYADALMWKAAEGLVPLQGLSQEEYGFWASPPRLPK